MADIVENSENFAIQLTRKSEPIEHTIFKTKVKMADTEATVITKIALNLPVISGSSFSCKVISSGPLPSSIQKAVAAKSTPLKSWSLAQNYHLQLVALLRSL